MTAVVPPRPDPPRRWSESLHAWLAWFGVTRLVASALSVAVVVAGVAWLVRSPPPPTEAGLPSAASVGNSAPTLPAPTSPSAATGGAGHDGVGTSTSVPVVAYVHVAGAVLFPGVHRLSTDDRVHSAIEAAGGPSPNAELDSLNLAAPVRDGERIYVPIRGEVDPAEVPSGPPASPTAVIPGSESTPSGPIDLNEASSSQLEALPGIGPATAAAIVDDRDRRGPFASVDDLQRVPGIGPAKLAAIADLVTV